MPFKSVAPLTRPVVQRSRRRGRRRAAHRPAGPQGPPGNTRTQPPTRRKHAHACRLDQPRRKPGSRPQLRYTPAGTAVAEAIVPVITGRKRKVGGEYREDEPTRVRVIAFERLAENLVSSAGTGDRLVIVGRLHTEAYADRTAGEKRTTQKLTADATGYSLRFHTVTCQRTRHAATTSRPNPTATPPQNTSSTQSSGNHEATRPGPLRNLHPRGCVQYRVSPVRSGRT